MKKLTKIIISKKVSIDIIVKEQLSKKVSGGGLIFVRFFLVASESCFYDKYQKRFGLFYAYHCRVSVLLGLSILKITQLFSMSNKMNTTLKNSHRKSFSTINPNLE